MKRSLSAVVVVLALLVPASASAAGKKYVGEFADGGKVSFKVVRQDDGDKNVKRFKWSSVPITCNDGDHTTTSKPFDVPIRVTRRSRFRLLLLDPSGTRTRIGVIGKIQGRKADGWISAEGRIRHDDGWGEGCSTGKAKWHAERA